MLIKLSHGKRSQSLLIDHQCRNARCRKGKSNKAMAGVIFGPCVCVTHVSLASCSNLTIFMLCHILKTKYVEGFVTENVRVEEARGRVGCLALCRVRRSEGRLRVRKESIPPPFSSLFILSLHCELCLKFKFIVKVKVNEWEKERLNDCGQGDAYMYVDFNRWIAFFTVLFKSSHLKCDL